MKKLYWFAVSLTFAFTFFCVTAFLGLWMSGVGRFDETKAAPDSEASAEQPEEPFELLAVLYEDDRILASTVEIGRPSGTVTGETVDITAAFGPRPNETVESGGLYPFLEQCRGYTDLKPEMFTVLSAENLIEAVDICGGLETELEGKHVLLTGNQVYEALNDEIFTEICIGAVRSASASDLKELFLYLADNTVNNLKITAVHTDMIPERIEN